MKKNIFNIVLLLICFAIKLNAQVSSIKTMDLGIYPPSGIETGSSGQGRNIYHLTVKIDSIQLANKLYFLLGSSKDSNDILNVEGLVTEDKKTKKVSIELNGNKYPFINYTVLIPINLSEKKYESLNVITFYIKDKQNKLTTKSYLNIKP